MIQWILFLASQDLADQISFFFFFKLDDANLCWVWSDHHEQCFWGLSNLRMLEFGSISGSSAHENLPRWNPHGNRWSSKPPQCCITSKSLTGDLTSCGVSVIALDVVWVIYFIIFDGLQDYSILPTIQIHKMLDIYTWYLI